MTLKQRNAEVNAILGRMAKAKPEELAAMCSNPANTRFDRVNTACKRAAKSGSALANAAESVASKNILDAVAQNEKASADQAQGGGQAGGSNTMLYVGIGLVAVLVIGGGLYFMFRGNKASVAPAS